MPAVPPPPAPPSPPAHTTTGRTHLLTPPNALPSLYLLPPPSQQPKGCIRCCPLPGDRRGRPQLVDVQDDAGTHARRRELVRGWVGGRRGEGVQGDAGTHARRRELVRWSVGGGEGEVGKEASAPGHKTVQGCAVVTGRKGS